MSGLLNVDVAIKNILDTITLINHEVIDITDALNRILAEDIYSDINLPPFANSSMDGFAVKAEDVIHATQDSPVQLNIVIDIPAGKAPDKTLESGQTARIMTGAPMPDGADAVIPVEDTNADWSNNLESPLNQSVKVFRSVHSGDYVRPIGEDIQTGELTLKAGMRLRPQEIGVLVALGKSRVRVIRQPRIAIISTGDELIGVDEALTPGKIRDTNSYTLSGLITNLGGIPIKLPVARDTLDDVRQLFQSALTQQPDMIISSAGVSVGAADFIRDILRELGQVDFWRINLRPGKPLAYGQIQGVPFFGLPGNPVSAMVTFHVLVRPALLKMSGQPNTNITIKVITQEDMTSDGRRSYIRVKLIPKNNQLYATITGTQSSGASMSMVLADALMIIPEEVKEVKAGTALNALLLKTELLSQLYRDEVTK